MEYNYSRKDNAILEGEVFNREKEILVPYYEEVNAFWAFLQSCLAIFRWINLNYERCKEKLQDKKGNESPSCEEKLEMSHIPSQMEVSTVDILGANTDEWIGSAST